MVAKLKGIFLTLLCIYSCYITLCMWAVNVTCNQLCAVGRCCWCPSEGYCSPECRKKAWVRYHWLECPFTHTWNKVKRYSFLNCMVLLEIRMKWIPTSVQMDWMLRLCLRIVLMAAARENPGTCTLVSRTHPWQHLFHPSSLAGGYSSICSLLSHKNEFSDHEQRVLMEKVLPRHCTKTVSYHYQVYNSL